MYETECLVLQCLTVSWVFMITPRTRDGPAIGLSSRLLDEPFNLDARIPEHSRRRRPGDANESHKTTFRMFDLREI